MYEVEIGLNKDKQEVINETVKAMNPTSHAGNETRLYLSKLFWNIIKYKKDEQS